MYISCMAAISASTGKEPFPVDSTTVVSPSSKKFHSKLCSAANPIRCTANAKTNPASPASLRSSAKGLSTKENPQTYRKCNQRLNKAVNCPQVEETKVKDHSSMPLCLRISVVVLVCEHISTSVGGVRSEHASTPICATTAMLESAERLWCANEVNFSLILETGIALCFAFSFPLRVLKITRVTCSYSCGFDASQKTGSRNTPHSICGVSTPRLVLPTRSPAESRAPVAQGGLLLPPSLRPF